MQTSLRQLISDQLANQRTAFSIGGAGALAEFAGDVREVVSGSDGVFTVSSPRGGLQLHLKPSLRALAWEALSAGQGRWQQGIALFIERSTDASRSVLTEMGTDSGSIAPEHRHHRLFDLGAGLGDAAFCVRTDRAELLQMLRAYTGQPVLEDNHPLLTALVEASPHRVVLSGLARIEVYQAIARDHTPDGPHTHLLPQRLNGRHHLPTTVPLRPEHELILSIHPEHPLLDPLGQPRSFDPRAHGAFQGILRELGDPEYVRTKTQVWNALRHRSGNPELPEKGHSRLGRLAQRIALRQLALMDHDPAQLAVLKARFGD